jgi:mycothiol system anti-sigma-R factor
MIDCREAVRRMWAYLDHELGAEPVSEFEAHLESCQRCCGELEFSRHMREIVADKRGAQSVPPALRARIEILLANGDERAEDPA